MSSRTFRWIVVGAFALVLVALGWQHGLATDKEAQKYVGCAQQVLHGDFHDISGNYARFAAYVLFLLPFVALGSPLLAVIAQGALALAAGLALARMVERISGSRRSADLAFALIMLSFPLQQWVLALYTESFFVSLSILFLERVTRSGRGDGLTWLLAVLVLFARPVGILFVGPALIWKLGQSLSRGTRIAAYAAVIVAATLIPGIARDQLAPIVEGHVICGFPELPHAMNDFEGSSIASAQAHLFHAEGAAYTAGLFFRRVLSLFTLPRPYYSTGHNIFLSLHYALFALAPIGWWRHREQAMAELVAAVFLLNTALVGLTHDEWSGRFLVPLWPLLCAFAAMAFPMRTSRDTMAVK